MSCGDERLENVVIYRWLDQIQTRSYFQHSKLLELILLFSSGRIICIASFSMKRYLKDVSHLLKASDEMGCNHINQYGIMYLIASVNVWKVP